jgi:CBS domain-containing protein
MKVDEVMTRGARTCGPDDPLTRAAQIMWEADCGCVPVVDAEGKPIAMVTDRDACMAAYTRGRRFSDMTVSSAASKRVVSVRQDDELAVAEHLMREYQIRRLPVVDDHGRLVGLLSMNDLVRRAHESPRPSGVSVEGVLKTLAAVGSTACRSAAAE